MCGIVGYIGEADSVPILLSGLKRLEYRGYDSAGIALLGNGEIIIQKNRGKISRLEKSVKMKGLSGSIGIAHTRWATHGKPSSLNAHPHTDENKKIALIHNGIIENYASLRSDLEKKGHRFETDTDTEILVQLIAHYMNGSLEKAVRRAINKVEGTYGIAVISSTDADKIVAARSGAPLAIGLGDGENFVASDISAFAEYTKEYLLLDEGDISVITRDGVKIISSEGEVMEKETQFIEWNLDKIEKNGHAHFMLKEIYEQGDSVKKTMSMYGLKDGKFDYQNGPIAEVLDELQSASRVYITACGTSWHAGLIGEYLLEQMAGIPIEVEYASEFRYRNPIIDSETVVIAISQSGETADTLAAIRMAKDSGANIISISNVLGSTIARESSVNLYTQAGPEIGVASTKAFTTQVVMFTLIALALGHRIEIISDEQLTKMIKELETIPHKIDTILGTEDTIREIADRFSNASNFLYAGRGYNFPIALEGALKLKEISYIHAEGYPAAEMKHGPIALIDKEMPVVFIAPRDNTYAKILSNIREVKARDGMVIALANEGDEMISNIADQVIYLPETIDCLYPLLAVIPLQLLAYHIAVARDCDVDQPRNLAKSVTVE
ncbi:glutamine--fructose-6-phosphate transaminase (isomerizing) [Candidatus Marinimicrobia bacterium MT.SAG.3]|nr:glutamine--fructose-6-phosphate transaminase (isomerizing) [Candidatus Marinimicrobia bacterium MT.SAG.3]